jgi:hypothetical protein
VIHRERGLSLCQSFLNAVNGINPYVPIKRDWDSIVRRGRGDMAWIPQKSALGAIQKRWQRHGFEITDSSASAAREPQIVPTTVKGLGLEMRSFSDASTGVVKNLCGCCSSHGQQKRAYAGRNAVVDAQKRSKPALLEIYECPVLMDVWHLRSPLWVKKRSQSDRSAKMVAAGTGR